MEFDATFWVAISFIIFLSGLVYLKIPHKINDLLSKMIVDIKKEIDESEKLRTESNELLNKAKNKLDSAEKEKNKIIDEANNAAERLIIEMNDLILGQWQGIYLAEFRENPHTRHLHLKTIHS